MELEGELAVLLGEKEWPTAMLSVQLRGPSKFGPFLRVRERKLEESCSLTNLPLTLSISYRNTFFI